MTTYRTIAPMITPGAFRDTIETQRSRGNTEPLKLTFYRGDVVLGVEQADIDRLVADGFLEAVEDGVPGLVGA